MMCRLSDDATYLLNFCIIVEVSSTETGVIFGNIVYDGPGTSESNCVVLNDIHIDIMDYINPAYCNETQVSFVYLKNFMWFYF